MKFLIDTSFIVSATGSKIDVVTELRKFGKPEMYVLDLVIQELEKLSSGRGKKAKDSRLSLAILGKVGVNVIKTRPGNTDRKIMTYALNRDMTVCTIDAKLKRTLLKRGAKVVIIRQGKYLVFAPPKKQLRGG